MSQALGIKGSIQFAREAAWATALAATHRIGFEECTIESKPQIAISRMMPSGTVGTAGAVAWMGDPNNAGIEVVGEYAAGRLVVPMDYNGLWQFFDMLYGTATYGSYGAGVTGTGPYAHTFGPEKEALNSMCMQIDEGGVESATSKVSRAIGMKVAGLTLSGRAAGGDAGILRLSLDMIGQQKVSTVSPTAAISAIGRLPVYFGHMSAFDDGSGDTPIVLDSFELNIKPALAAPVWGMGSKYIQEPVRNGLIVATLKIVRRFTSIALINAFKAGTLYTGTPTITFTSFTNNFVVTFQNSKIIAAPQPVPGLNGLMMQEVTFQALWSGATNGGVTIVATTAQAGAAA